MVLPDYEIKRSAVYCLSPVGRQRLPKVRAATERLAALLVRSGWDRVDPRWVKGRPC